MGTRTGDGGMRTCGEEISPCVQPCDGTAASPAPTPAAAVPQRGAAPIRNGVILMLIPAAVLQPRDAAAGCSRHCASDIPIKSKHGTFPLRAICLRERIPARRSTEARKNKPAGQRQGAAIFSSLSLAFASE